MHRVRHSNTREFACTQQAREHHGIAGVVLLPLHGRTGYDLARRPGNQIEDHNLSKDVISTRTGLMDRLHQPVPISKLPHQIGAHVRFVRNRAVEANLTQPSCFGYGHRNRVLMDVQSDICIIISHDGHVLLPTEMAIGHAAQNGRNIWLFASTDKVQRRWRLP